MRQSKRVARRIGIFDRHELPRERAVDFESVGLGVSVARIIARIVVVQSSDVVAKVHRQGALVAAVEVPFDWSRYLQLGPGHGIGEPADVGCPGTQVEAALVRKIKAALYRRLFVRLADAP